jgi:hypothetical protein
LRRPCRAHRLFDQQEGAMEFDFGDLNYLAVLAGIIINMALGALW